MLPIPRGIVYHSISYELKCLFLSFFSSFSEKKIINKFESKFAKYNGSKFCIAFPYARTAIFYSLKYKNLSKGSEVIMPPISIKGILDVVLELGLVPIFVDIDPKNLCFEESSLKKKINKNTKAIIITYLYGIVPNLEKIIKISKKNNLFIIEDFSHNLYSQYKNKKVGTFGNVGVYSSSSIKTLDTFGGGLAITDDENIYKYFDKVVKSFETPSRFIVVKKILINLFRNLATNRVLFFLFTFPIIKILKKLYPNDILKYSGTREVSPVKSLAPEMFYAYTSFQAKVGLNLLKSVFKKDKIRIDNVNYIKSQLKNIDFPEGDISGNNVYWQFVFFPKDASKAQDHMHKNKIDTATSSLVNLSSLKNYGYENICPKAQYIYTTGLFIPSYHSLKKKELKNIANILNAISN